MIITAILSNGVVASNSAEAFSLNKKSCFGEVVKGKVQYMLTEALYLVETKKIQVLDGRLKEIKFDSLLKKLKKFDKRIQIKYSVYKDLRKKGHILKTALKFGADFRVYEKGSKPGKRHAKWVVFADNEFNKMGWHEFSAKNRVAHSTKKKLLLAIVDEESDITYYEVNWIKP